MDTEAQGKATISSKDKGQESNSGAQPHLLPSSALATTFTIIATAVRTSSLLNLLSQTFPSTLEFPFGRLNYLLHHTSGCNYGVISAALIYQYYLFAGFVYLFGLCMYVWVCLLFNAKEDYEMRNRFSPFSFVRACVYNHWYIVHSNKIWRRQHYGRVQHKATVNF